jgi:DNA polymerase sigma
VNQHMFVIVDPVNPTNNTARNSFRTPDVLNHFRAAFFCLKSQFTKEFNK